MVTLSESQRQVLEAEAGRPVLVVDEQNQRIYYLISAEQFEQIRALLPDEEFSPRELYPQISKTASDAGWNDPLMDAYDHYDGAHPTT